jgi:hypothetical protein
MTTYTFPIIEPPKKLGDMVVWNNELKRWEWKSEEEFESMQEQKEIDIFMIYHKCPACNLLQETVMELKERIAILEGRLL